MFANLSSLNESVAPQGEALLRSAPYVRSEGSNTETSRIKRRRENGRFEVSGELTEEKKRKAEKRMSYNSEKQRSGRKLFDEFVQLFFLKDSPGHWVPTSSNSGPLVTLANKLIRPTYLPSQEERSTALFRTHERGILGNEKATKRVTTRAADAGDVPHSVISAFVGRRLPSYAKYTAEIEPIREWISEICAKGYTRFKNRDDAFALCLDVINSYVVVNGEHAYNGYPKPKKAPSSPQSILPSTPPRNESRNTSMEAAEDPAAAICSNPVREPATTVEENAEGESTDDGSRSRSSIMRTQAKAIREIAHDEEAFVLLCLLFDKESEDIVISCAGACIEEDDFINQTDNMTKDFLLYAHKKAFAGKDDAQHQFREEGLRSLMNLAVKARAMYGLAPYSEIREKYFPANEDLLDVTSPPDGIHQPEDTNLSQC